MQCPRCQAQNDAGASFCEDCGARLELACPSCGRPVSPGKRFCRSCGAGLAAEPARYPSPETYIPKHLAEKILTSKSALEGERKQVTVLFADLKGSMELLADRDPEEARTLLDPLLERMMEGVHRYEGTVNQVMGDGIMALFGAPVAHEDHAVRACYAALRMQESVTRYGEESQRAGGVPVQIRVGLNSGEVVVRSIGSDLRMDYTAVGQTTHVAARTEQLARPGTTLVTAETLKLAEGYVLVKPLGAVPVKGLDAPVEVYELTGVSGARSRLQVAAARGLTKFVGRDAELDQLRRALVRAEGGHGQVAALVGEPGVGKSRLVWEITHSHRTHGWLTLESSSVSYGKASGFLPIIDLLRRYFQIEDRDDQRKIREKVSGKLVTLDQTLMPTLPVFLTLLDVPSDDPQWQAIDPALRRQRTLDAVKRLLLRESQIQPLLVVFEDLHWIDAETQAFLDSLVDSLPATRILLLVNYRPEYQHAWGSKTYYTQLRLDPLPPESAEELLRALLGEDTSLRPLKRLLIERTDGNPLFLEEIGRTLVEAEVLVGERGAYRLGKPVQTIQVPATVQAVLAARIDRLPPEDKRLLQTASVIGETVPFALLQAVVEMPGEALRRAVSRLQAAEFLYETSLFPDLEYTFKHGLTCRVSYDSLLTERRKELHRRIAEPIERLHADRLAEQYGILAHHFSKGEDWAKALEYLAKAAEKAARAFGTREALALYDRALEAAGQLGESVPPGRVMAILQAKSMLCFVLSDFERSRAEAEHLLALARRVGDRGAEARALVRMGSASMWAHDFDRALEYCRRAIEVATQANASRARATAQFTIGSVYTVTSRLDQARGEFDQVRAICRSTGDVVSHAMSLIYLGLLRNWEAAYDEALRLTVESLSIAREHTLLSPLLNALFAHGLILTGKGDYDDALVAIEEGLALSEKVGGEVWRLRLLNTLGWLHMELGDLDRAEDLNRRGAEGARERGEPETIANAEINLGDIFLAKGDLPLAREVLDRVHRLVEDATTSDWMKWRYAMHLFTSLGELWLARGHPAKAQEFADQALEIATRTNSRKYLVKGWRLHGEIAAVRKQWHDADEALRRALSIARAIGNPTQLWKTHLALGRFQASRAMPDAAHAAFQAARGVVEDMKRTLRDPRLRASLEAAPEVREVWG